MAYSLNKRTLFPLISDRKSVILQLVLVQVVNVELLASSSQDLLFLLSLSFFLSSSLLVSLFSAVQMKAQSRSTFSVVHGQHKDKHTDPLQVTAVARPHAGQSRLLLSVVISLLLGISLLPYPPLLLCTKK